MQQWLGWQQAVCEVRPLDQKLHCIQACEWGVHCMVWLICIWLEPCLPPNSHLKPQVQFGLAAISDQGQPQQLIDLELLMQLGSVDQPLQLHSAVRRSNHEVVIVRVYLSPKFDTLTVLQPVTTARTTAVSTLPYPVRACSWSLSH